MAEEAPESGGTPEGSPPPTEPESGAGAPEGGTPPDADPASEIAKWKALARKHEARARAGAAAEKRLADLEDASKSELEKAQETARTQTERADRAELRALRAEVAARKGLTTGQAKRLQGVTEEELETDADELLAAFKPQDPPRNGSGPADRAPVPRLRPGAVPDAGPVETDPRKLAESIPRSSF